MHGFDPYTPHAQPAGIRKVRVRDLPVLADVGIIPDEIGNRQPLSVSVELTLADIEITDINDTVDYRRIVRAAESLSKAHIPLIESFAQRLAAQCLAMGPVLQARVIIDKPFALERGMAGVEVELCAAEIESVAQQDNRVKQSIRAV